MGFVPLKSLSTYRKPMSRTSKSTDKSRKDLTQAASLIDHLTASDPDALRAASANLHSRGAGWTKRLQAGLRMLRSLDLADGLDLSLVGP